MESKEEVNHGKNKLSLEMKVIEKEDEVQRGYEELEGRSKRSRHNFKKALSSTLFFLPLYHLSLVSSHLTSHLNLILSPFSVSLILPCNLYLRLFLFSPLRSSNLLSPPHSLLPTLGNLYCSQGLVSLLFLAQIRLSCLFSVPSK